MSMPLSEFWELSPREFWGYFKGYEQEKENRQRLERHFVYNLVSYAGKEMKRRLKPEDILRFPDEQPDKANLPTLEEMKAVEAWTAKALKGVHEPVSLEEFKSKRNADVR